MQKIQENTYQSILHTTRESKNWENGIQMKFFLRWGSSHCKRIAGPWKMGVSVALWYSTGILGVQVQSVHGQVFICDGRIRETSFKYMPIATPKKIGLTMWPLAWRDRHLSPWGKNVQWRICRTRQGQHARTLRGAWMVLKCHCRMNDMDAWVGEAGCRVQ